MKGGGHTVPPHAPTDDKGALSDGVICLSICSSVCMSPKSTLNYSTEGATVVHDEAISCQGRGLSFQSSGDTLVRNRSNSSRTVPIARHACYYHPINKAIMHSLVHLK